MITEFRDESGELIATQNSTIIETATTGGKEEGK
jgi:hypothetical protein